MSELKIQNLFFSYAGKANISQLNLSLAAGEIGVIIGRSGAGKSTILKLVAGLLKPASGQILVQNKQVLPPDKRLVPGEPGIKLVSQTFDLMPFISAKENICQGMMPLLDEEKNTIANKLLHALGLENVANEKTKNLSGGQQQRVAIARALAEKPNLLLLDEVFAQLDKATKTEVMLNLKNYISAQNATALFVLHDAEDAFYLADKVFVLQNGAIVQQDSAYNIYSKPANAEVAQLFGHGNFIPIQEVEAILNIKNTQELHRIGTDVFFRPNQCRLSHIKLPYEVITATQMPTHILYVVQVAGYTVWIEEP